MRDFIDSIVSSIFSLAPWPPPLAVCTLCCSGFLLIIWSLFGDGFFRSYGVTCGDTGFAGDSLRSLGSNGHENNSCGKPKRKCSKAASLSWTSPFTFGHCKRWQVSVWCHVPYVLPFDPVNKSDLYLCFLFTCLSKITLTSTWKEVKKIIKEDPRCIKFSSSDRVRGFCLRFTTVGL